MTDTTKECPYCGEEILDIAKKCKHCGEWLDSETANETTKVETSSKKEVDESIQPPQSLPKGCGISVVVLMVAVVVFLLSFHILPDHRRVFPKENLTFEHTFVTNEDIDALIRRYNNASFFERNIIRQEPIMRTLTERGIIVWREAE